MFGWIKESAVYEVGYISNDSWDEETSSYKVDIPEVVLFEASTVIEKGYLFLIHGTIEASDGTTEILLQANKLEKQSTPDGDVIYISFADGSTLTKGLLTIPYSEEGGSNIKNIWDGTGEGAVAGGSSFSTATGIQSFAVGGSVIASGDYSHAEGGATSASANYSHAEGDSTKATGIASHAEGQRTTASGSTSHSEGNTSIARGDGSHAEGYKTEAGEETYTNPYMHAEGNQTKAIGDSSHSEGERTTAYETASHAEGLRTSTYGTGAHAEGTNTKAGIYSTSMASASHAEGDHTEARNAAAHAEGYYSKATGPHAHAEGQYTEANGADSHAEGFRTIANGERQHVGGYLNIADTTSIEIIGNGTGLNARSNARTLDASGNEWLAGQIQPELGLRLKAPNGTYYNVTVDNTGALSITTVT